MNGYASSTALRLLLTISLPAASFGAALAATGPSAEVRADAPQRSVAGLAALARRLGMDEARFFETALGAVADGAHYLPFDVRPYASDPAARLRVVEEALPILKAVVSTGAFREAYAELRADRVRVEEPAPIPSAASMRDEQKVRLREAIAQMERNVRDPQMPAAAREGLRSALTQMRAQLRELEARRVTAAELEAEQRNEEQMRAMQLRAHEAERARREQEWPEDASVLVRARLRAFLALTEAMPWDARLVPNAQGKRVFADPALERRGDDWKMCFRAGRPVVEAARAFARGWLAELG